jgi:alpha-amylase/alpha-mannosidase (GH57 family)
MSFNFGPTLLTWLETETPEVYRSVLEADRESRERFSGHGSAIAQAYNHMILPLANARDRETQVYWGIRDFEHRFRRSPEGMWLPEAAVDVDSLETLARHGIRFTILAPQQAARSRRFGDPEWTDVSPGTIDSRLPYEARLPSGRRIAIFFYDGPLSHAVAFGELHRGGEHLAARLDGLFSERAEPQLAHIATDGETYGHHHRHGEVALAVALDAIERGGRARLTNYGEYLALHPPLREVEIREKTSWSCAHGLGRWTEDCSCRSAPHPGWTQAWRAPLRESLDWLRDALARRFEQAATPLLADPWRARDHAIEIVLDPSAQSVSAFLRRHAARALDAAEQRAAIALLEMQRHAMLMYTSCGWFFDDPSGLETQQILRYAGRAIEICRDVTGEDLEGPFLDRLERARSNVPDRGDARLIYAALRAPAGGALSGT